MKKGFYRVSAIAKGAIAGVAAVFAVEAAWGQGMTIEGALNLARQGLPKEAIGYLDSIAAAQPKNAEPEYEIGRIYSSLYLDEEATAALESALKKGSNNANLELAMIAARAYRLDEADEYLKNYRAYLTRNKKKKLPDESADTERYVNKVRGMFDRVEQVNIIDSIVVDKNEFFEAYMLSPEAGSLLGPEILPKGDPYAYPAVVYLTEDRREMIWAENDTDGVSTLVASNLLNDGSWETPEPLGIPLPAAADSNYPFLMPDGVTLYFASNSDEGLGGYDIYISRSDGDKFLQPQNLGMPYNSPYNDYMLAIDEMTGIGWWASDRNDPAGSTVTIYIFRPEEMRHNVPIDDPQIVNRASLRNVADLIVEGPSYTELSASQRSTQTKPGRKGQAEFEFYLPDGRVARTPADFRTQRAADTMMRYLSISKDFDDVTAQLTRLRAEYSSNKSVGDRIIALERRQADLRQQLQRVANDVIRAEGF